MRYRKKPIVIEAFCMTRATREDNRDWPVWLDKAWNKPPGLPGSLWTATYTMTDGWSDLRIGTLEGVMAVGWGDYIIQGVKGEIYPCKAAIFHMTYEEVSDE